MKWIKHHQKAEKLAAMAEFVGANSPTERADLYLAASQAEYKAVEALRLEALPRTRAILTVSMVALALKAGDIEHFDDIVRDAPIDPALPQWAKDDIAKIKATADIQWNRI